MSLKNAFLVKLVFKKILPAVVGIALVVLAGLWLHGYLGVKCGWIGATDYPSLNAVSHHGAETAGGLGAIGKHAIGL
ncbi:MAG: hypothetical protein IJS32_10560 [Kiritimatiellae bacterium]|nr:hypothetical protein [Kiritimatiellia bacterium]